MSNKSKVTVCFVVPVESAANGKEIRAAYTELRRQIVQFANAITRDPNVIVTHSVVSADPKDLKPAVEQPADSKIAEIQSIKKAKAVETTTTPTTKKSIPDPVEADDNEEKPHIVAGGWTPPVPAKASPAARPVKAPPAAPVEVAAEKPAIDSTTITDNIFKDLKRSEKSVTIVNYLVKNIAKELTVEDLVAGTKLDKTQVSSWLATTSDSVPGLTKVKRGVYKFTVTA